MTTSAPSLDVRFEGVGKRFGPLVALDGIELVVPQGSYVAVMGPNGAGKTTLLRTMAGLVAPTQGTVRVAGIDMRRAGPGIRSLVGYVGHESMLYGDLSVAENLRFYARLFALPDPDEAVAAVVDELAVEPVMHRFVRALSRGTLQRVAIARALLHAPSVLLMDEPYTGLDEAAAVSLADLLEALHTPERTLVLTVHEIHRALAGPERLVVLDGGRLVLDRPIDGDAEELGRTYLTLLGAKTETP